MSNHFLRLLDSSVETVLITAYHLTVDEHRSGRTVIHARYGVADPPAAGQIAAWVVG